jgi:hypothetical protein
VVKSYAAVAFEAALDVIFGPLPMFESGIALANPLRLTVNGVDNPPAGIAVN